MAETFFRRLQTRTEKKSTLLCIGLDPHVDQLPEPTAEAACAFCLSIIAETCDYAALFKPNAAFFEQFGADGILALQRVISAVPSDIPVLLDCKRGDIDTTAQANATSAYSVLKADAVTLSPYMGWDSVKPFVTGQYANKGAFVLCKTSNPSAQDLQSETTGVGNEYVYEKVVKLCNSWNAHTGGKDAPCVGVVAGATDLDALQRIRALAPEMWILCPGVGAQGGEAAKVCPVGLRADGSGLLISVSRSISSKAALGPGAMAAEAERLRDEINGHRVAHLARQSLSAAAQCVSSVAHAVADTVEQALGDTHKEAAQKPSGDIKAYTETSTDTCTDMLKDYQKEFLAFAIAHNALQFGQFKLKSGRVSPYFFNAGLFHSGASLATLSRCYARAIREAGIEFDVLFGPAYKGIPLATAVAMALHQLSGETGGPGAHEGPDVQVAYNRKEVKDHGEGGQMVGAAVAGRRVLIVDDVITAGTAIREAVRVLRAAGAEVVGVAVCLDREERVSEDSPLSAVQQVEEEFGFPVLAVVRFRHIVHYLSNITAAAPAVTASTAVNAADEPPGQHSIATAAGLSKFTAEEIATYKQRYGVHSD